MKEELYIIKDDNRYILDLPENSGITLRFVSNMFTDLSKFCASYSYTFKLPKTARNTRAFDLLEDIRHESDTYGRRVRCEYWRDGIKIINESFLYISEVGESYSAVMTWNVLSWLFEVSKEGLKINELDKESRSPETIQIFADDNTTDMTFSAADKSLYAYFRCGRNDNTTMSHPAVVPVRHLLEKIAVRYGKKNAREIFSFLKEKPLTNRDFDEANGKQFSIFEDGAIPLISGKWSPEILEYNTSHFGGVMSLNYNTAASKKMPFVSIDGNKVMYLSGYTYLCFNIGDGGGYHFSFIEHKGFAEPEDGVLNMERKDWSFTSKSIGYIGFKPKDERYVSLLKGLIRFVPDNDWMNDKAKTLYLIKFRKYSNNIVIPYMDENGVLENPIEIVGTAENNVVTFNMDPSNGGEAVELEVRDEEKDYAFWCIVSQVAGYVAEGRLDFVPKREDSAYLIDRTGYDSARCAEFNRINLYSNLPNIPVIDFLKSLFYIDNGYPIIRKDGKIGIQKYKDLYTNIAKGEIYDWSRMVVGDLHDDATVRKFTTGDLGRMNIFAMSNYTDTQTDKSENGAVEYARPYSFFETRNNTLDDKKVIFTFPFSSANIRGDKGEKTGNTFIYWKNGDNGYEAANPNGIIGRVYKDTLATYGVFNTVSKRMAFRIWQTCDVDYEHLTLAYILRNPYVISLDMVIDTLELSNIDFSKPVYLEQFNSFFAIVSLLLNSKGITKAEFIKLPVLNEEEITETATYQPTVTIEGPDSLYRSDKSSSTVYRIYYNVNAYVNGSYIKSLSLYIDGMLVAQAENTGSMSYQYDRSNGTHTMTAVALAGNGKTGTASKSITTYYVQNDDGESTVDMPYVELELSGKNGKYYNISYEPGEEGEDTNFFLIRATAYNAPTYKNFVLYIDDVPVATSDKDGVINYVFYYNYVGGEVLNNNVKVKIRAELIDDSNQSYMANEEAIILRQNLHNDLKEVPGMPDGYLVTNLELNLTPWVLLSQDKVITYEDVWSRKGDVLTLIAEVLYMYNDDGYYPYYTKWCADLTYADGTVETVVLNDSLMNFRKVTCELKREDYENVAQIRFYAECYIKTSTKLVSRSAVFIMNASSVLLFGRKELELSYTNDNIWSVDAFINSDDYKLCTLTIDDKSVSVNNGKTLHMDFDYYRHAGITPDEIQAVATLVRTETEGEGEEKKDVDKIYTETFTANIVRTMPEGFLPATMDVTFVVEAGGRTWELTTGGTEKIENLYEVWKVLGTSFECRMTCSFSNGGTPLYVKWYLAGYVTIKSKTPETVLLSDKLNTVKEGLVRAMTTSEFGGYAKFCVYCEATSTNGSSELETVTSPSLMFYRDEAEDPTVTISTARSSSSENTMEIVGYISGIKDYEKVVMRVMPLVGVQKYAETTVKSGNIIALDFDYSDISDSWINIIVSIYETAEKIVKTVTKPVSLSVAVPSVTILMNQNGGIIKATAYISNVRSYDSATLTMADAETTVYNGNVLEVSKSIDDIEGDTVTANVRVLGEDMSIICSDSVTMEISR